MGVLWMLVARPPGAARHLRCCSPRWRPGARAVVGDDRLGLPDPPGAAGLLRPGLPRRGGHGAAGAPPAPPRARRCSGSPAPGCSTTGRWRSCRWGWSRSGRRSGSRAGERPWGAIAVVAAAGAGGGGDLPAPVAGDQGSTSTPSTLHWASLDTGRGSGRWWRRAARRPPPPGGTGGRWWRAWCSRRWGSRSPTSTTGGTGRCCSSRRSRWGCWEPGPPRRPGPLLVGWLLLMQPLGFDQTPSDLFLDFAKHYRTRP